MKPKHVIIQMCSQTALFALAISICVNSLFHSISVVLFLWILISMFGTSEDLTYRMHRFVNIRML